MYEPPAPESAPHWQDAADPDDSQAVVWPSRQRSPQRPADRDEPTDTTGPQTRSERFRGRPEITDGRDDDSGHREVAAVSAPPVPPDVPGGRGSRSTGSAGDFGQTRGVRSTGAGGGDNTGEFPRWSAGLVPPVEDRPARSARSRGNPDPDREAPAWPLSGLEVMPGNDDRPGWGELPRRGEGRREGRRGDRHDAPDRHGDRRSERSDADDRDPGADHAPSSAPRDRRRAQQETRRDGDNWRDRLSGDRSADPRPEPEPQPAAPTSPPSWLELMRRDAEQHPPDRETAPPARRATPQPHPVASPELDKPPRQARQESGRADASTVLTAVRELPGVRGAELVGEPGGTQVLRLDLVASVDPHIVGRQAAALLRDRLGVTAAVRARSQRENPALSRGREDQAEPTPRPGEAAGLAVTVEQVQVVTAGPEAAVEVGLAAAGVRVAGRASGPAHDWHVLRAAVTAATEALGMLLAGRARLALEYAEIIPAGPAKLAVVSLLLLSEDGAERVAGASPVNGEPPDAAVRATIAAVRHRLPELLDPAAIGR